MPAAWGDGCLRIFAAKFNSKSPSQALAFFCPRRAERQLRKRFDVSFYSPFVSRSHLFGASDEEYEM